MIHFELIFVNGVRSVSRFIFFACGYPAAPAPFVEETVFAPLYAFAPLSKGSLYVYFWVVCSVTLTYWSILLIMPYCLDYYSCKVSLEVGKHQVSNFVPLLNIMLAILGLLPLYINFRIS